MSKAVAIIAVTTALLSLSTITHAAGVVGCPNGTSLSGTAVISGDPNAAFPVEPTPDKVIASGSEDAPDYTSQTWTLLSELPRPLSVQCSYQDGSVTNYALPDDTTTCTYYTKPQRGMTCQ